MFRWCASEGRAWVVFLRISIFFSSSSAVSHIFICFLSYYYIYLDDSQSRQKYSCACLSLQHFEVTIILTEPIFPLHLHLLCYFVVVVFVLLLCHLLGIQAHCRKSTVSPFLFASSANQLTSPVISKSAIALLMLFFNQEAL